MLSSTLRPLLAGLVFYRVAVAAPYSASATSTESVTAPADFLWPAERPWYVEYQNNSPCGTNSSVSSRTEFPLDDGLVSLTIASNAYSVALRIAYMDDPTSQSNFNSEIVHTISEIEAGHQCYSIPDSPSSIAAGTNATIQLEYTAQYNGSAYEIFYACADITFVESSSFTTEVSCFNATVTGASANAFASSSSTSSTTKSHGKGLSAGAKVGIAVGVIIGSISIVSLAVFLLLRKRAARKDTELAAMRDMKEVDVASFTSSETQAH